MLEGRTRRALPDLRCKGEGLCAQQVLNEVGQDLDHMPSAVLSRCWLLFASVQAVSIDTGPSKSEGISHKGQGDGLAASQNYGVDYLLRMEVSQRRHVPMQSALVTAMKGFSSTAGLGSRTYNKAGFKLQQLT
jgi:hypothetical protein